MRGAEQQRGEEPGTFPGSLREGTREDQWDFLGKDDELNSGYITFEMRAGPYRRPAELAEPIGD